MPYISHIACTWHLCITLDCFFSIYVIVSIDFSDVFLANVFLSLTIFSVLSILHTKLRYLKNKSI